MLVQAEGAERSRKQSRACSWMLCYGCYTGLCLICSCSDTLIALSPVCVCSRTHLKFHKQIGTAGQAVLSVLKQRVKDLLTSNTAISWLPPCSCGCLKSVPELLSGGSLGLTHSGGLIQDAVLSHVMTCPANGDATWEACLEFTAAREPSVT